MVVYSSQVCQTDLTRIDDQSIFWQSLLDRLHLQVYFSRVYILAFLVIFIRFSIQRLASPVYILVQSTLVKDRDRLSLLVYFTILHPRFASLFQSSRIPDIGRQVGRDTVTLGPICISRVYILYSEIQTYFSCLFFEPTSSLCESILVNYNTGPRQRHSNAWPNMYQSILLSLQREINIFFVCIFFDFKSSLRDSILIESKTRPRQRQTNAWPNIYQSSLLSLDKDKDFLFLSIFRSYILES